MPPPSMMMPHLVAITYFSRSYGDNAALQQCGAHLMASASDHACTCECWLIAACIGLCARCKNPMQDEAFLEGRRGCNCSSGVRLALDAHCRDALGVQVCLLTPLIALPTSSSLVKGPYTSLVSACVLSGQHMHAELCCTCHIS
jgi:hypothetical protein